MTNNAEVLSSYHLAHGELVCVHACLFACVSEKYVFKKNTWYSLLSATNGVAQKVHTLPTYPPCAKEGKSSAPKTFLAQVGTCACM